MGIYAFISLGNGITGPYATFPVVMYGCESWTIKLSAEELMFLNCGVEDSWASLGQQGDPTSQS